MMAVLFVAGPLFGGVTITTDNITATANAYYPYDPQNSTYGVTTFNMTGSNSAPAIQIVPDNDPSESGFGLQAGNQVYVVEQVNVSLGQNTVLTQTFTPSSTFNLGAVAILGNGGGTTDSANMVSYPMSIHLFDLTTGYASTNAGASWGGYVPSTAAPGGDLLGGGAGLQVTFNGSNSLEFYELNFNNTGTNDAVSLVAGHHYAFEVAPQFGTPSGYAPLNMQRESGAGFDGGNTYLPGDAYYFAETQNNDVASTRGNMAGSDRDMFMAFYAAAAPTILLGDLNFDGHVDAKDIAALELALTNESGYLSHDFGNGTPTSHGVTSSNIGSYADVSGGSAFNNADLQKLETYLIAGHGSTTTVPEPASLVLLGLAGPAALWFTRRRGIKVT